ncbi:hypothetical protein TNCV_2012291 [Trichonephila clavipes]|nr:hypothetical protein TNCV_2012291 [Trichonephila clavipes]
MLPSVRYLLAKVHGTIAIWYSWRTRRRILRTDDGGKPNRLAASRALLVPEAATDAIASISTAMQGARASFKHGHPARARSSNFLVSSKRLTSFKRPADEAHFWLNGYVNKQNCRIWSEANPQVYCETPLHPEKLTVWCALWAGGIIGPSFFKNDEGHNVTVNGDW